MCESTVARKKKKESVLLSFHCLRGGCRRLLYFPSAPQTGGKYVFFIFVFFFLLPTFAFARQRRTQMCTCTLLSGGLQGNGAERKLRAFAKQELSGVMATVADYPTLHQSGRGGEEERWANIRGCIKMLGNTLLLCFKRVNGTTAPPVVITGTADVLERGVASGRRNGKWAPPGCSWN